METSYLFRSLMEPHYSVILTSLTFTLKSEPEIQPDHQLSSSLFFPLFLEHAL